MGIAVETESVGHKKIKNQIKNFLIRAQFAIDSEVDIDFDNDGEIDWSIDVCAIQDNNLLVIQCKDRSHIDLNKEVSIMRQFEDEILSRTNIQIIHSDFGTINPTILKKIKKIRFCFAFTEKLQNEGDYIKKIEKKDILFWNSKAILYYDKVTKILNGLTKYEILKEFQIDPPTKDVHSEEAIELIQNDDFEAYLMAMHPGLLLKFAYAFRRTSDRTAAYQRVVKKERIQNISNFLQERGQILPNAVIIAFDKDPKIQSKIKYSKTEKTLSFPLAYCSAFIVDGQHRILGFQGTDYENWDSSVNEEYKIPVVAFRDLSLQEQAKNFIDINYNQKKIDTTLLCDLAVSVGDLRNELAWPSALVTELNSDHKSPWFNKIKISEYDRKKPVSVSSFARYVLLKNLLGYNKRNDSYSGPLYKYSPFNRTKSLENSENQISLKKQAHVLNSFFKAVQENVSKENPKNDPWINQNDYDLTKYTSVNGLLLVLNRFMENKINQSMFIEILEPIAHLDFSKNKFSEWGKGFPGFSGMANYILKSINNHRSDKFKTY